jgi:uncharacterized protein (DUF362 family)
MHCCEFSRRRFLASSLVGGLAAMAAPSRALAAQKPGISPPSPAVPYTGRSRVALTTGDDRADLAFRALREFRDEVARAIGDRTVVIKPNNVAIDIPLAATHAANLEGILEFLKSIGKLSQAVIAESAAAGPTMEGFSNFGYPQVAAKYGVKLLDLDQEPVQRVHVFDQTDFRPRAVRMSRLLLDPKTFIISAARLKTHDRIVATLSLKNVIFGAPIKDPGFRWGKARKPGSKNDKPIAHGGGMRAINFNLFDLARRMHPHLAVIDGFDGMEGNGPCMGTPVDHRVCVVGTDWLAADRVGVALMGVDFARVGYLNYCADAGMGQADLEKIELVGEPLARHVKTYRLAKNIDEQLIWMKPPAA